MTPSSFPSNSTPSNQGEKELTSILNNKVKRMKFKGSKENESYGFKTKKKTNWKIKFNFLKKSAPTRQNFSDELEYYLMR